MTTAVDAQPEVLTLDEAAKLLRVCTHTLSKRAKAGEVPGKKLGREWRFLRSEILELLRRASGDRAA